MILETILGSALGGALRLAPEILRWLDRKADRAHELAMLDRQAEGDKQRAAAHLAEIQAAGAVAFDASALQALTEALRGQAEMAVAAGGRMAALSASVRPVATYWLLLLYGLAKAAACAAGVAAGSGWLEAVQAAYTPADQTLLSGVLNFWFLDRVMRRSGA